MARSEFSPAVRDAAWKRSGGRCQGCTAKLFPSRFAYDHIKPDGLGGEATLENCQVLCTNCHNTKTVEEDRPPMQKADNVRKKHIGAEAKGRGWAKAPVGYNPWTRRIET